MMPQLLDSFLGLWTIQLTILPLFARRFRRFDQLKFADSHSHRSAKQLLDRMGLHAEITRALDAPELSVAPGCSRRVKRHVALELGNKGWASPMMVDATLDLEVNFGKDACLLQVQTGNIARAFYDLMKMQSMFEHQRADCAVLVVPTRRAARIIGGNLAQFERVKEELEAAFYDQIGVPVYLIGFE